MNKLTKFSFFFLFLLSSVAFAAADTENSEESLGLQVARRDALNKNTKELPSRGYQLSSFVVRKTKGLQAVNIEKKSKAGENTVRQ